MNGYQKRFGPRAGEKVIKVDWPDELMTAAEFCVWRTVATKEIVDGGIYPRKPANFVDERGRELESAMVIRLELHPYKAACDALVRTIENTASCRGMRAMPTYVQQVAKLLRGESIE